MVFKVSRAQLGVAIAVAFLCSSCSPAAPGPSSSNDFALPAAPTSQKASSKPSPSFTDDPRAGCVLSPEELKAALGEIVGPGAIVINDEYTGQSQHTGTNVCSYKLPVGSLTKKGAGGKVLAGGDEASFTISRYTYASNYKGSMGVYNVHRDFGGSTAEQILDSWFVAERDTKEAQRGKQAADLVRKVPNIGMGAVSDGEGGIIVTTDGRYWFDAGISGVAASPAYEAGALAVARLLATKG